MGEYDFSEERLQDTDGIKPPQIGRVNRRQFRELQNCRKFFSLTLTIYALNFGSATD